MAELLFKRGKQSALDTIIKNKTGVDGCFYLTEDTNRLYVGQGDGQAPVLLNQVVSVVESIGDLPKSPPAVDNDFYYIKSLNVLAVYDSSKKTDTDSGWVQINANTNDTIKVDNIAFELNEEKSNDSTIVYSLTLSQKKYDKNSSEIELEHPEDLVAELTLNSSDIASIVPEAASVGIVAENVKDNDINGVKIKTDGDGSNPDACVTLIPGANISQIAVDNNKIAIAAHNNIYDVRVDVDRDSNVNLQLFDNTDEDHSNVKFVNGKNISITGVGGNTNSITIDHEEIDTADVTITNKVEGATQLNAGSAFTSISGITFDNGHITGIATETVNLPADTHFVSTNNTTAWTTTFIDSNDDEWTVDFSGEAKELEDGLKEYIDQGLAAANTALTYKGTISKYEELALLTKVEVGDVYLLNAAVDSYQVGDLFIATSKSNKAGELTADDLTWTYVPSGDEIIIDTLFYGVASINGKTGITDANNNGSAKFHIEAAKDSNDNVNTPAENESLELVAGQGLELINNTNGTSTEKVATIRHADIQTETPATDTSSDTFAVTAITGVEVENGHITKIETTQYNIATYELTGANNFITLGDSAENSSSVEVAGDNWIDATVTNNKLQIMHNSPVEANPTDVVVENGDEGQLTAGQALNIISGVHYDTAGHIVSVDTEALTLPTDTVCEYYVGNGQVSLNSSEKISNPSLVLKDSNDNVYPIQLESGNGNLTITGAQNKVTFNMVWGSF